MQTHPDTNRTKGHGRRTHSLVHPLVGRLPTVAPLQAVPPLRMVVPVQVLVLRLGTVPLLDTAVPVQGTGLRPLVTVQPRRATHQRAQATHQRRPATRRQAQATAQRRRATRQALHLTHHRHHLTTVKRSEPNEAVPSKGCRMGFVRRKVRGRPK